MAIRVPELGKPGLQAGAVVARLGSGLCLLSSRIENTSLFSCLRSSTTTTTSTSATLVIMHVLHSFLTPVCQGGWMKCYVRCERYAYLTPADSYCRN